MVKHLNSLVRPARNTLNLDMSGLVLNRCFAVLAPLMLAPGAKNVFYLN